MIEVSSKAFFEAIGGPENIHPRSEPDHSAWEIVGTREVIGRSEPGYKCTPGPKRYWLVERFASRVTEAAADEKSAQE
ncbi:hypothetical protein SAMN05216548_11495 [Faunimonas pinastri]|uniref:Uncharacterized protein n=1 Tax=Faunimonas pinastri TaxID=1855383 RepID=A0A1H9MXH8_9HYPH|nr:hypothetical protein [Faunimonas pinastri]SER28378.1 hypothetical protein SAMN05216548_11495 [Faunimonas pinastri]